MNNPTDKHPLETVREALDRAKRFHKNPDAFTVDDIIDEVCAAYSTLTAYMGDTQSCAECKRRESVEDKRVKDMEDALKDIAKTEEYGDVEFLLQYRRRRAREALGETQ